MLETYIQSSILTQRLLKLISKPNDDQHLLIIDYLLIQAVI